jgi:SprB repeat
MVQNNDGANYKLSFVYGGPAAPPFTVVVTRKEDTKCHGDSTGVAGVTTYGPPTVYFYQWSAFTQNFFAQTKLPAGTYTVTVTDQNGITGTNAITIAEPAALGVQLANVTQVDCNGTPGSAIAVATGGVQPYAYRWSNGLTTDTLVTTETGLQQVSITDANGCAANGSVTITGTPNIRINQAITLCPGESYLWYNRLLSADGEYTVVLDNPDGCDTLVSLSLRYSEPLVLDTVEYRNLCSGALYQISPEFSGGTLPYSYFWEPGGGRDSILQAPPGVYQLVLRDATSCAYVTQYRLFAFTATSEAIQASGPGAPDGAIRVSVTSNTPVRYLWSNGATTKDVENLRPGNYCLTVTDASGCTQTTCNTVSYSVSAEEAGQNDLKVRIVPNPIAAEGILRVTGPDVDTIYPPDQLELFDIQGRRMAVSQHTSTLHLPAGLASGQYYVRVVYKDKFSTMKPLVVGH